MARLACVSIDLDELIHYARIHGFQTEPTGQVCSVHEVGGRRFGDLCSSCGISGTLFVVGQSLSPDALRGDAATEVVRALYQAGHEIANHSYSHDYRLIRGSVDRADSDIRRCAQTIEAITGELPRGFRAPGYNTNLQLMTLLAQQGYAYDSSVLPSPPYYVVRAAAIAALKLFGRPSVSMVGKLGASLHPSQPHRIEGGMVGVTGGLLELPISTFPRWGLPFIGTVVTTFPWPVVRFAYQRLARTSFLNFELHGLDLIDRSDGVDNRLLGWQPGLDVPLSERLQRLAELVGWIRRDFDVLTLQQAAALLSEGTETT